MGNTSKKPKAPKPVPTRTAYFDRTEVLNGDFRDLYEDQDVGAPLVKSTRDEDVLASCSGYRGQDGRPAAFSDRFGRNCSNFMTSYCSKGNRFFLQKDCKRWAGLQRQSEGTWAFQGKVMPRKLIPQEAKLNWCSQNNRYQTDPHCYNWCNGLVNGENPEIVDNKYREQCRLSEFEQGYCQARKGPRPPMQPPMDPEPPGSPFQIKCDYVLSKDRTSAVQHHVQRIGGKVHKGEGVTNVSVMCQNPNQADFFVWRTQPGITRTNDWTYTEHSKNGFGGLRVYENSDFFIGGIATSLNPKRMNLVPNKGKYKGRPVDKVCPNNSKLIGLSGHADSNGVVRSLEPICSTYKM